MDELAVYDARIEIADFAIEALKNVPSEPFVERLLGDDLLIPDGEMTPDLDEGFELLGSYVDANADRPTESVVEALETEYSRLFVGPRPPIVAHETHYRDDTDFIGQGLAEVQASYSAAGWASPDEYPEEDDFVAVELAFLRHLISRQRDGAEEAFGYERVFLDEHLDHWIEEFAADVAEQADSDFYRAVGRVVAGFVDFEDELAAQMA
jgi:TorA maturation chaperone TorD